MTKLLNLAQHFLQKNYNKSEAHDKYFKVVFI